MATRKYAIELTGKTPLLLHPDDIDVRSPVEDTAPRSAG